ncbi:hypothetical protein QIS99_00040 [Streptomyces sp. B-S-A8]|uniref:Uncharacterized protein n=1 Tax=Streptomyces solicavernae TaxID=3043614 RepID=A0ABT6RJL3_9ACTN|nr:hypothetical protein [Streptomyces sp. B-S-A8]MDI3384620.1 hypothetical protein [Streptomyces sp. B-S-A8]
MALGVAVVGVLGTLLSALLTQRASDRSRRYELEQAERQRLEDLAAQRHETVKEQRRAAYVMLNKAARQYQTALTDHLHVLLRGEDRQDARAQLDEARSVHRDCYAEAQLIVPDPVLDLAGRVNKSLNATYGMIKRLDNGTPRPGDSLDAVQASADASWDLLRQVRHRMRSDLGVVDAE